MIKVEFEGPGGTLISGRRGGADAPPRPASSLLAIERDWTCCEPFSKMLKPNYIAQLQQNVCEETVSDCPIVCFAFALLPMLTALREERQVSTGQCIRSNAARLAGSDVQGSEKAARNKCPKSAGPALNCSDVQMAAAARSMQAHTPACRLCVLISVQGAFCVQMPSRALAKRAGVLVPGQQPARCLLALFVVSCGH